MSLTKESVSWAVDFISTHSDGDLFPKMPEIEAIMDCKEEFADLLSASQLSSVSAGPCRRFIVPKDEFSYRQATQLNLQDSIVLSALLYQYGGGMEARRLPRDKVFSYRYDPSIKYGFYGRDSGWGGFWARAKTLASQYEPVLCCDIVDFYNQIYHHTVENQLIASGLSNPAIKWIVKLLEATTAGVSRGVPIGPHAVHLIAELSLIPIDNSIIQNGIEMIRYADDIIIFCHSEREARGNLAKIAAIIDKQQRFSLQRHKTKILDSNDFIEHCDEMIQDRPVNRLEADLLSLIGRNSGGNPYASISRSVIDDADWRKLSDGRIEAVVTEYMSAVPIDYTRLSWFYRRLAQVGHPGAIEVSLENAEKLTPCFAGMCYYLASVRTINAAEWLRIGDDLIEVLEMPEVRGQEYFRLSILSLFSRNSHINHFPYMARWFQSADPVARREILLAAKINGAFDWIREHKEDYESMDYWQKIAYVYCISGLHLDEKKYLLNKWPAGTLFEQILFKWSKIAR